MFSGARVPVLGRCRPVCPGWPLFQTVPWRALWPRLTSPASKAIAQLPIQAAHCSFRHFSSNSMGQDIWSPQLWKQSCCWAKRGAVDSGSSATEAGHGVTGPLGDPTHRVSASCLPVAPRGPPQPCTGCGSDTPRGLERAPDPGRSPEAPPPARLAWEGAGRKLGAPFQTRRPAGEGIFSHAALAHGRAEIEECPVAVLDLPVGPAAGAGGWGDPAQGPPLPPSLLRSLYSSPHMASPGPPPGPAWPPQTQALCFCLIFL